MSSTVRHLCIDMQRVFAPGNPWATPWMSKVLPAIAEIVDCAPERTIFTRFLTPMHADDAGGMWQAYYRKWEALTRERAEPTLFDIVPELQAYSPPASVFDRSTYSAFTDGRLHKILQASEINTLLLTGAETDVCVLSTALSAVDLGYQVVMVTDALCSSSDKGHDALMELYRSRFDIQIQLMTVNEAKRMLETNQSR